jgi:hypothetical protein
MRTGKGHGAALAARFGSRYLYPGLVSSFSMMEIYLILVTGKN